ncbi:MAG: hypothetical protein JO205_01525 [Pseudolabrys sp.]|nr:hypothetical protein [Pseudolabrys sp.]MBV9260029.1 hypothetical protein [Pseudolabrys sp.]
MMLGTVFASAFIVASSLTPVSLDPRAPTLSDPGMPPPQISVRQRETALLPLVRRATDCIVRQVKTDPRYSDALRPGEINDLIVDVMPACALLLRAMIDTHDRMYGKGSGEAFLLGPYLDILPGAVAQQVKLKPAAR